jgi:hypothetical protein
MSYGVLFVTNHMMNRGGSRIKYLQQFKCVCCTKPKKLWHFSPIKCPSAVARPDRLSQCVNVI